MSRPSRLCQELCDNNGIELWETDGSVEITEPALKYAKTLLGGYEEPKPGDGIDEALRDYIGWRERKIPARDELN